MIEPKRQLEKDIQRYLDILKSVRNPKKYVKIILDLSREQQDPQAFLRQLDDIWEKTS